MSNDIGGDELNQGGDITANDVQQRNKGAEYFLRNSWMELQEWKDKLAAYESLPLTSALPIAHYRASVYQAQAMAYKEAVGADSNEKRAAFVRRAGALGLLAEVVTKMPGMSLYALSDDVATNLCKVEPVDRIVETAKNYMAAVREAEASETEGTIPGPSTSSNAPGAANDNGETAAFVQQLTSGDSRNPTGEGRSTPHTLSEAGMHNDEDVEMEDLAGRDDEGPVTATPNFAAANEAFNSFMAKLKKKN